MKKIVYMVVYDWTKSGAAIKYFVNYDEAKRFAKEKSGIMKYRYNKEYYEYETDYYGDRKIG